MSANCGFWISPVHNFFASSTEGRQIVDSFYLKGEAEVDSERKSRVKDARLYVKRQDWADLLTFCHICDLWCVPRLLIADQSSSNRFPFLCKVDRSTMPIRETHNLYYNWFLKGNPLKQWNFWERNCMSVKKFWFFEMATSLATSHSCLCVLFEIGNVIQSLDSKPKIERQWLSPNYLTAEAMTVFAD